MAGVVDVVVAVFGCTGCGIAESSIGGVCCVGVQTIDTLCRLNIEGDFDLYIRKAFVIFGKRHVGPMVP
jgi:hypothetical protein